MNYKQALEIVLEAAQDYANYRQEDIDNGHVTSVEDTEEEISVVEKAIQKIESTAIDERLRKLLEILG